MSLYWFLVFGSCWFMVNCQYRCMDNPVFDDEPWVSKKPLSWPKKGCASVPIAYCLRKQNGAGQKCVAEMSARGSTWKRRCCVYTYDAPTKAKIKLQLKAFLEHRPSNTDQISIDNAFLKWDGTAASVIELTTDVVQKIKTMKSKSGIVEETDIPKHEVYTGPLKKSGPVPSEMLSNHDYPFHKIGLIARDTGDLGISTGTAFRVSKSFLLTNSHNVIIQDSDWRSQDKSPLQSHKPEFTTADVTAWDEGKLAFITHIESIRYYPGASEKDVAKIKSNYPYSGNADMKYETAKAVYVPMQYLLNTQLDDSDALFKYDMALIELTSSSTQWLPIGHAPDDLMKKHKFWTAGYPAATKEKRYIQHFEEINFNKIKFHHQTLLDTTYESEGGQSGSPTWTTLTLNNYEGEVVFALVKGSESMEWEPEKVTATRFARISVEIFYTMNMILKHDGMGYVELKYTAAHRGPSNYLLFTQDNDYNKQQLIQSPRQETDFSASKHGDAYYDEQHKYLNSAPIVYIPPVQPNSNPFMILILFIFIIFFIMACVTAFMCLCCGMFSVYNYGKVAMEKQYDYEHLNEPV